MQPAWAHSFSRAGKGKRFAPNSEIMIHQPLERARQASDVAIQAEQILKAKEKINRILALNTGQPIDKTAKDTDRDFYMTAEEALNYGLIDKVYHKR